MEAALKPVGETDDAEHQRQVALSGEAADAMIAEASVTLEAVFGEEANGDDAAVTTAEHTFLLASMATDTNYYDSDAMEPGIGGHEPFAHTIDSIRAEREVALRSSSSAVPSCVLKKSVDKTMEVAKGLDETVEPVAGLDFHSPPIAGGDQDELYLAMPKAIRFMQPGLGEHLNAHVMESMDKMIEVAKGLDGTAELEGSYDFHPHPIVDVDYDELRLATLEVGRPTQLAAAVHDGRMESMLHQNAYVEGLDMTLKPVVGFDFCSPPLAKVDHDERWATMLEVIRSTQLVLSEHHGFTERTPNQDAYVKEYVDKMSEIAKGLHETVEPMVGADFLFSPTVNIDHDELWSAMLKATRSMQPVFTEHDGFKESALHQNAYGKEHVSEIVFRDLVDGEVLNIGTNHNSFVSCFTNFVF